MGFTLKIATHNQYPITPFLCLVEPRLGLLFFRDDSGARDRGICADLMGEYFRIKREFIFF